MSAALAGPVSKDWTLLGEVYGDNQGGSGGRFGARHRPAGDARPDLLLGCQDATPSTHWFTIELNLPLSR